MESVDLSAVDLYLPPVTIDDLLPPDPDTPQTCYAHPGSSFAGCLDVTNRFGDQPLRLGGPLDICVPSVFPAIAVDAFRGVRLLVGYGGASALGAPSFTSMRGVPPTGGWHRAAAFDNPRPDAYIT